MIKLFFCSGIWFSATAFLPRLRLGKARNRAPERHSFSLVGRVGARGTKELESTDASARQSGSSRGSSAKSRSLSAFRARPAAAGRERKSAELRSLRRNRAGQAG